MKTLARLPFLVFSFSCFAFGSQLIVNGGFETGTFNSWTLTNQPGSFPGLNFSSTPRLPRPNLGARLWGRRPARFMLYRMGWEPGTKILSQSFTIAPGASSVVLSFSMFVNSAGGQALNPIGLDFTDGANQQGRVDLLRGTAGLFDTGAGVLGNFYQGVDAGTNPHMYTNYSFDITSLVGSGGNFILRFAEVDNLNVLKLNMGVDNVSINTSVAAVPEPSCVLTAILGMAGVAGLRLRRRRL
jgi:hypothetical protein